MASKRANRKIIDIVKLRQFLKKWKKIAVAPKSNSKSIKFLKRTLSFTNTPSIIYSSVPKGFLALCVGEEMKKFIIPMEYLSHRAFRTLLREAEEEFGFEQEGILRIPCDVSVFESIVEMVEKEKQGLCCCSVEAEFALLCHCQEALCT
ncbi:uncharacterized protein A4U43_C01F35370 [Asparagus officinalis]|uniref:Uncharacterized protein n=1 Tax=Asparagus officinalis TaxID=4686 RepID=A0A5P1FUM9_ASPOF|nr:indole-3-acetic acid-induced protein ARG7-like [Asparagus officinalis]ONK82026.1 uncharacterized protein A4U43_C01F35370 [Asparagus officinalis]